MIVVKLTLSAVLVVLAAIHLLWALGYWWPLKDEAALTRAVVGTKGLTRMPGAVPCALVVVALLFSAAWPWFTPGNLTTVGLVALIFVFVGRGALTYSPAAARFALEDPFARLNRIYYSPLCLILGLGFIAVLLEHLL